MRQQNSIKTPIVFRIALVLLCVMLFSFYLIGGLYARYTASASGGDSARVARFEFSDDLTDQFITLPISLSPGEHYDTSVQIQNSGEVAIHCVVTVENLTGNLPIESKTYTSTTIVEGEETTLNVVIEWPAEQNSIEYMGKSDIFRIRVTVEQVD